MIESAVHLLEVIADNERLVGGWEAVDAKHLESLRQSSTKRRPRFRRRARHKALQTTISYGPDRTSK